MGQVNNVQLKINLKANTNRKSDFYGKLYGYTDVQNVLSTRGLCQHISNHGTIFTRDIVQGVITKLCECIPELVGQGVPVKLDGIGIFYPTAKNVKGGLDGIEAAKATNPSAVLEGIHVRFRPDGTQLDDLTSKAFKEKCSLIWGDLITSETITVDGKPKKKYTKTPISNPIEDEEEPEP